MIKDDRCALIVVPKITFKAYFTLQDDSFTGDFTGASICTPAICVRPGSHERADPIQPQGLIEDTIGGFGVPLP